VVTAEATASSCIVSGCTGDDKTDDSGDVGAWDRLAAAIE